MAFKALVAECPKTGQDLQIGQDLPLDDPRYPTYVRVKSVMDFPLMVTRCPIPGCGEEHTFTEAELREVIVPGAAPDSIEEHSVGKFIIEMEFYKLSEGGFYVWPYVKKVGRDGMAKHHFVAGRGSFPSKDSAREAALGVGRKKVEEAHAGQINGPSDLSSRKGFSRQ